MTAMDAGVEDVIPCDVLRLSELFGGVLMVMKSVKVLHSGSPVVVYV
jgi:hypothetical protein